MAPGEAGSNAITIVPLMLRNALVAGIPLVLLSTPLAAQTSFECREGAHLSPEMLELHEVPEPPDPPEAEDRYPGLGRKHRLEGTACYYSDFFEGRKTANGEIFRQRGFTAAHRTLPLGTWVEVTSIATGKKARVRVNDRGPFSGGFILDLSRSAARFLGVDRARDRRVKIRVLALPGDELPEEMAKRE